MLPDPGRVRPWPRRRAHEKSLTARPTTGTTRTASRWSWHTNW